MEYPYTLFLQFPEKSMAFDEMIELGDSITRYLRDEKDKSEFDGHDIGSGQIDFFIYTSNPEKTFEIVSHLLGKERMEDLKAAYRERDTEGHATGKYFILWPKGAKKFKVI